MRTRLCALALAVAAGAWVAVAFAQAPEPNSMITVRAIKAKVMSKADPFAKPVGELERGDQALVLESSRGWYRVLPKRTSVKEGWIHGSFVVARSVALAKLTPGGQGKQPSPEEIELAGRGFSREVEAEYRKGDQGKALRYEHVDAIEQTAVDPAKVGEFMTAGRGGGR